MERRHYEAIADMIAVMKDGTTYTHNGLSLTHLDAVSDEDVEIVAHTFAVMLARYFADENPRFDARKWFAACNTTPTE